MMASLRRILVVFALTFQEARRRRLLIVFLVGCIVFMGSGSACTYGCRKLDDAGGRQYRAQLLERMEQQGLSQEERAAELAKLDDLIEEDRKEKEKGLKSVLVVLCFVLIAFWVYLLAAFFTPFLALNDFFTGHHVLILARPTRRWEYLVGKFAATGGMLLSSLLLLLACYLLLMKLSAGVWGVELLRGVIYLLQGISVFIVMLMLLTLVAGRLAAVFLSLLIVAAGAMPGYLIATQADLGDAGLAEKSLVYGLAYGLPQFGVNFVHAFAWMARDLPGFQDTIDQSGLAKIGNNSGMVSVILNTVWFLAFWSGLLYLFRRRELHT